MEAMTVEDGWMDGLNEVVLQKMCSLFWQMMTYYSIYIC